MRSPRLSSSRLRLRSQQPSSKYFPYQHSSQIALTNPHSPLLWRENEILQRSFFCLPPWFLSPNLPRVFFISVTKFPKSSTECKICPINRASQGISGSYRETMIIGSVCVEQSVKPELPWKQKKNVAGLNVLAVLRCCYFVCHTKREMHSILEALGTRAAWRNASNNVRYWIGSDILYVEIILVTQRLRAVYHGIFHELLALY